MSRSQQSPGTDVLLVLVTVPDLETGRRLARVLLERRTCACVNLVPEVGSLFRWKGTIEEEGEVLLLIKAPVARWDDLQQAIREHHPYDVPEILAFRADRGDPAYLSWLHGETRPAGSGEEDPAE